MNDRVKSTVQRNLLPFEMRDDNKLRIDGDTYDSCDDERRNDVCVWRDVVRLVNDISVKLRHLNMNTECP